MRGVLLRQLRRRIPDGPPYRPAVVASGVEAVSRLGRVRS